MESLFHKGKNGVEISFHILGTFLAIQTVEGDVHLPQGRLMEELCLSLGQQGAIGGEIHPEALFVADVEELMDLRMKERLSLDMEIQVVRMGLQLIQSPGEFLHGEELLLPLCGGTEAAGQIAGAGDFEIDFLVFLHVQVSTSSRMIFDDEMISGSGSSLSRAPRTSKRLV
jgi:hypothetical protein